VCVCVLKKLVRSIFGAYVCVCVGGGAGGGWKVVS